MERSQNEFFKLDPIDKEVLLWLTIHAPRSLESWIKYIAFEYRRKNILIDPSKLYQEALESDKNS